MDIQRISDHNRAYWSSSEPSTSFLYDAYMHLDTILAVLEETKSLLNQDPLVTQDSISSELHTLEAHAMCIYASIQCFEALWRDYGLQ